MRILGVPIDVVTRAEVLARCTEFLRGDVVHQIVTANPEFVLSARNNPEALQVMGQGSLVVPDGVGLVWAARRYGTSLPERVPGIELATELCQLATREGRGVYLVGGRGVAETAAKRLRAGIPRLQVTAFQADHRAEDPPSELWSALERVRPSVLFVAYGAPQQELWIHRHRRRLESSGVRIAMGVGGAFDMLADRFPRAPHWMRAASLEWLWRIMLEPSRLLRVLRATVLFPLLVHRER